MTEPHQILIHIYQEKKIKIKIQLLFLKTKTKNKLRNYQIKKKIILNIINTFLQELIKTQLNLQKKEKIVIMMMKTLIRKRGLLW